MLHISRGREHNRSSAAKNPYGDGYAAKRIVERIVHYFAALEWRRGTAQPQLSNRIDNVGQHASLERPLARHVVPKLPSRSNHERRAGAR
jgi:hypothetical protein